jgi:predicted nucleic acid-binding protein
MGIPRRLWDSCVVTGYLCGASVASKDTKLVLEQAGRGEIEIVVSAVTEAEVAFLQGVPDDQAEEMIREFFSRDYIVVASVDRPTTRLARSLIRQYKLKHSIDAIILATARRLEIPILETFDNELLALSGNTFTPPIDIRRPHYDGTMPMFGST